MESRISRDLVDSLVMSISLFITLCIAGLLWASFGAGYSLLFALAYFVARVVLVLLRDEVYDKVTRIRTRRPHTTA